MVETAQANVKPSLSTPSKLINVYGVAMNALQEMKFSKHLSQSGISMNTLTPTQRTSVVLDWLDLIHRD